MKLWLLEHEVKMNTVALSIIGTSDYEEAVYELRNKQINTPYIQKALHSFAPDIHKHYIFGTKEAKNKHWQKLSLLSNLFEFTEIPEGKQDSEFWETYNIIRNKIPSGVPLIIDVTHGYRVQPIIMLSVVQYLSNVKGNTIDLVIYGSFKKGAEINPVFDITPFFELGEWSAAVAPALHHNNFAPLAYLLADKQNKSYSSENSNAIKLKYVKQLGSTLEDFFRFIKLNRIREAIRAADLLKNKLGEMDNEIKATPSLTPLKDIIERLSHTVSSVAMELPKRNTDLQNHPITKEELLIQLKLIKIVIESGSILQAMEMAVEWVLTVLTFSNGKNVYSEKDRENAKYFLRGIIEKQKFNTQLTSDEQKYGNIAALFKDLGELRNDLSHCGWRSSPIPGDTAYSNATKFINKLMDIGPNNV